MPEVFHFKGKKAGAHLLVLGAVHGNETAGPKAIQRLIPDLQAGRVVLTQGELTLIPVCNLKAYQQDVRQIDENLNRVMKWHDQPTTYEQTLANDLVPYLQECDVLLDLHSSHCPGDIPFAFCDYPTPDNQKLVQALPVEYVLQGWPTIYRNNPTIQDFSTEWLAHEYGKSASTLECGYHKAPEAAEVAYQAILGVLSAFGSIEGEVHKHPQQHILMQNYVIKEAPGRLAKPYKHLDPVTKGQPLAIYEDGRILTAPEDGYILLPNPAGEIGAEWYYFGVPA